MDSDFAIITTDANELVADIHDRMPVIVLPSDYGRWFGDEPGRDNVLRLLGRRGTLPVTVRVLGPLAQRGLEHRLRVGGRNLKQLCEAPYMQGHGQPLRTSDAA